MSKLKGADLDRAVAHAMGLVSVRNCEKWKTEMKEDDDTQVYRSEMEAAVKAAYKDCAQIAETAEPYQAADLIRARAAMLFDDWDGGFPYRKEER